MSCYRPSDRYDSDQSRDYERDWDRGRPRSQMYRPSEDSRDARRDDRRVSRDDGRDRRDDRAYPPPFRRGDSSFQSSVASGQASPSVGSLASSPREPSERTPMKPPSIVTRSEKPSSTANSSNAELDKIFLDALNDLLIACGKRDKASKNMEQVEQQQKRIVSGMPDAAMESKIWQDKQSRVKLEYDSAQKKVKDARQRYNSSFPKLISHMMDQRDKKASPATPTLGQEQELGLIKKVQGTLQKETESAISDKLKVMQDALDKTLQDSQVAADQRQQQSHEQVQKIEQDIRRKLHNELNDEYAQKFKSLEERFNKQVDGIKDAMSQEVAALKQHYNEEVNGLKRENQQLRTEFSEKLEEVKTDVLAEKIEFVQRLDAQYKEELATLKEQVAVANSSAPAPVPAAELQSLREELTAVAANISNLSNTVTNMEVRDKAAVLESGQLQQQQATIEQLKTTIQALERTIDDLKTGQQGLDRDFRKVLMQSFDRTNRQPQPSIEPSSLHSSPAPDRHGQAPVDGVLTKKTLKKDIGKSELALKDWAMKLFGQFDTALKDLTTRITAVETTMASVRQQSDTTNDKVDNLDKRIDTISTKADAVSDGLDKQTSHARTVHEDFEMRISSLHQGQNSWRSNEFSAMMISHIQANTPGMLAHRMQNLLGYVDSINQRLQNLEGDVSKRRKMPNGHMAVNNQQGSPNANANTLAVFPPQNPGGQIQFNGHQQSQPQYARQ